MRHSILCSFVLFSVVLTGCPDPTDDPGPDPGPGDGEVGTRCNNNGGEGEPAPSGEFLLTKTRAIAGAMPVVGIDTDCAGGLWIAYRLQTGDYYSPADVRVVHLDSEGMQLSEWRYTDEFTMISGIAFSGDAVWLNYNNLGGAGNLHIRKLDPVTGDIIGSFATGPGIADLDAHGDELRLSSFWNEVIALDLETGGERSRSPIAGLEFSTQRGIASTFDDRLWVASAANNRIFLFDPQRQLIGTGTTDMLPAGWNGEALHLAWDGDELVLAVRNQIIWLAPPASGSAP